MSPQYPHNCLNDGELVFSASVINIFTDLLVTALPMPLIWSLKLPARQRLAVISIFGLGIIVNVAGSVRTVYVWKSMVAGYDTTWLGWPVLIAAAVEISLGLVRDPASSMPDSSSANVKPPDLLLSTSPPPTHCGCPTPPAPINPQHQLLLQQPKPLSKVMDLDRPLAQLTHGSRQRLLASRLRK